MIILTINAGEMKRVFEIGVTPVISFFGFENSSVSFMMHGFWQYNTEVLVCIKAIRDS